jgi:hypothetical protein
MVGGALSCSPPCLPRLPLSSPSCLLPPLGSLGLLLARTVAGLVHVAFAVCKLCKCVVEEVGASVWRGRLGRPASVEPPVSASVGRSSKSLGTISRILA